MDFYFQLTVAHWTERSFKNVGEYSTIDSAIMIAGAYFAGNYFGGEIKDLADSIGNTPQWETIFPGATKPGMYMISGAVRKFFIFIFKIRLNF